MNIVIVGLGYVGMSLAVLLSQYHHVMGIDTDFEKICKVNSKQSPVKDSLIEEYLSTRTLDLTATSNAEYAYAQADFVLISVPTNYNDNSKELDTSTVESVLENVIAVNKEVKIAIRSTVPVGFTLSMRRIFHSSNIIYSPEFLRESKALYDNLFPSRIVVGTESDDPYSLSVAIRFSELLQQSSCLSNVETFIVGCSEAEAIKLFSNSFLALRVSFFNEVDSFSESHGLVSRDIISGVCSDPRIGNYYNNPSFGFGGYCLPKDVRQLLHDFGTTRQTLISSLIRANDLRKDFIVEQVLKKKDAYEHIYDYSLDNSSTPYVVGIFRLIMKSNSDNFRHSAVIEIINKLRHLDVHLIIYEPLLKNTTSLNGIEVVSDLTDFKSRSTIILANRYETLLDDVWQKVYSRDTFHRD